MTVSMSPSLTQRFYYWTEFKTFMSKKNFPLQFDQETDLYTIWGYDGQEVIVSTIWRGTVPEHVINQAGYSQVTNDADKTDFETNYKPSGNRTNKSMFVRHGIGYFKNGSATNMNVNGSVTPQNFSIIPTASETYFLQKIRLVMLDAGDHLPTTFAAIAALTNGLMFEVKSNGVTSTYFNIQSNADLAAFFEVSSDATDLLTGGVLNGNLSFGFSINVVHPIMLSGDMGDFARFVVRDNLTALTGMRSSYTGWRSS